MTQPLPSRSARVVMAAASDPTWGSVRQKQPSFSPPGQELQPFLLEGVGAVFQEDHAGQGILDADDGGGGAVAGGDFLQGEAQFQVAEAGAIPCLGHYHPEDAQFAQFLQGLAGKGVVPVPFGGEGGQALLGEGAEGVADHFLLLGEDHAASSFF